jgi:hypothetical protein
MSIKCVARRMASTGNGHEHISHLWWENTETRAAGVSTREEMVQYVDANGTTAVWCPDRDPNKKGAWVHTNSNGRVRYVQTVADGRWTDNLLSLPTK